VVVLPKGTDQQFLSFLNAAGVQYEQFSGHLDLAPKSGLFPRIERHITRIKSERAMLQKIRELATEHTIVHTDIVPGQSLFSLAWLCLWFDVFITHHNAQPAVARWRWMLWKLKYRLASHFQSFHVFTANQNAAEYYRRLYTGRVSREMTVTYASTDLREIENVLSESRKSRESLLEGFNIPKSSFVVLTVGQFLTRKGCWVLLDAGRILRAKAADFTFIWVSPVLPSDSDMEKIREYGLGSHFKLIRSAELGTDHRCVLQFFQIADAFALPSFLEGLPIALLEAMGIGVPCIATNVNGIPEAIIDGETGLLIEPGNSSALSESLLKLRNDPSLREQLVKQARLRVKTTFDSREMAMLALKKYKVIFNDRNPV
jgi:glycosyltransferase involved in cell wall biosynthesis